MAEEPQQATRPDQHDTDEVLLIRALDESRQKYALVKLQYHLSRSGIKGYDHPKSIAPQVAEARRQVELIEGLLTGGEGIPDAPALEITGGIEVATELPDGKS
jgi:hypothetical protein